MKKRLHGKLVVVGMHPAIDRTIEVPRLTSGGVVRGRLLMVGAGGKGMNVVRTLANLGTPVTACGFLAENDAPLFLSSCRGQFVRPKHVRIPGDTRQNITIVDTSRGTDTHITSAGMRVSRDDVRRLLDSLAREAHRGDWVAFVGSRPGGVSVKDYRAAIETARARGAEVIADADGALLRTAVASRPWLIKPNREELEELTGRRHRSLRRTVDSARGLLDRCEHVLLTLGPEGAALVTRNGSWRARDTRPAKVVHTVGCGDALLGGFLSAYAKGRSPGESLRRAVACGSACVRTRHSAVQSGREAAACLKGVRVERLTHA